MSDGKASRLKRAVHVLGRLLTALLGWVFIAPWAVLVPRSRRKIAVIGRENGRFLDNAKYFFLEAGPRLARDIEFVFVTGDPQVLSMLAGTAYRALRYPTFRSIWFLLRCRCVVVDSEEWYLQWRRFFLVGSQILQLWHGVGFKRICIDRWYHLRPPRKRLVDRLGFGARVLAGGFMRYGAVNATSRFYRDQVFRQAFRSHDFPVLGYPRHSFGSLPGAAGELALCNTDRMLLDRAREWYAEGRRIVLVAPTYREGGTVSTGLTPEVVAALDRYCDECGVEIVLKRHPFEPSDEAPPARHLHSYNSGADAYPLLPLTSALVTDYSSIYMDYLLLDRPVLFLVHDLAEYVRQDRQLQFDFDAMTPGPKLQSWSQLPDCLQQQWRSDPYRAQRHRLRELALGSQDATQATARIIAYLAAQGWIVQPIAADKCP